MCVNTLGNKALSLFLSSFFLSLVATRSSGTFLGWPQPDEMKELRNSTGHQQKQRDFPKDGASIATQTCEFMNERVKVLSQRCCYVSAHFFKWVYGNP